MMKNLLSVVGCSNLLLPDCCDTKQFPSFHSFEAQPHHQLYPCCPRANDTRDTHTLPRGPKRSRAPPSSVPTHPPACPRTRPRLLARVQSSTSAASSEARRRPGRGPPTCRPRAGHSPLGPEGPPTPAPGPRRVRRPHVAGTRRVGRRGPGGAHPVSGTHTPSQAVARGHCRCVKKMY